MHVGVATERRVLRVFVVTDVRLYCEGLSQALASRPDVEVVGAQESSPAAVSLIASTGPEVVLVDSPTARGTDLVRRITAAVPSCVVVAFGVSDEPTEVLECAQAGVAGYVPRDASIDDLLRIVDSVARGELPCPPRVSAMMFRYVAAVAAEMDTARLAPLTLRERQIASLVERGLTNKEIASALSIGAATVKSHVHHILDKLGVARRAGVMQRLRSSDRLASSVSPVPSRV